MSGEGLRMRTSRALLLRVVTVGIAISVLGGLVAAAPGLRELWRSAAGQVPAASAAGEENAGRRARLDGPDTLALPADVVQALGVRTAEVKQATRPRPLPPLAGSLALDANCLVRVHARFAGEVVEIGTTSNHEADSRSAGPTEFRPLRGGDRVRKGQLLAVVWSKDLGEKKSELVDAVSRLRLDRELLGRLQESFTRGVVPERSLREQERNVEADLIAVARAERTLRAWRLTDEEIEAVRAEAEAIRKDPNRRGREDKDWARVEVRSPQDGTILEKNVTVGDLVDTSTDLFKVADLSRLSVWVHVYEETLPALQALPRPIPWTIRLKAVPDAPPLRGTADHIGAVIDPNQHTALVTGHVDNADGLLRAGQFVTATVEVPPAPDEVEVPAAALVEDGRASTVFVLAESGQTHFTARRVAVARRFHDVVYVRSRPSAEDAAQGVQSLRPGEQVVSSGAVVLKGALEELQSGARETP